MVGFYDVIVSGDREEWDSRYVFEFVDLFG